MHHKIALTSLALILVLVNWSIYNKEEHLAEGKTVYLKLAPVDPRSLMQGDYMALRFDIANALYKDLPKTDNKRHWRHNIQAPDGYAVVALDEKGIGSYKYIFNNQQLSPNELLMKYRVRNGEVRFATNAFFFQEGNGKYYEPAQYGLFRVDNKGELLLVAMFDKDLKKLKAPVSEKS